MIQEWSEGLKWSEVLMNRVSIMKFYCFFHILLVLLCVIVYVVREESRLVLYFFI